MQVASPVLAVDTQSAACGCAGQPSADTSSKSHLSLDRVRLSYILHAMLYAATSVLAHCTARMCHS